MYSNLLRLQQNYIKFQSGNAGKNKLQKCNPYLKIIIIRKKKYENISNSHEQFDLIRILIKTKHNRNHVIA